MGHAGVDGGRGDVRGGVSVAGGSGHADPRRRLDQGGRPGEFGGDGNDAQMTRGGRVQALEGGHVGSEHVPRILGTAPDRREKRPLQVNPGDDALAGQAGQHRGPGLEVGERRGDQAGHDGRAAVPAVELRGAPGVVGCPLGKRRATASMHVQVDESRQDPVAAQVGDGKLERQLFGRVAGPDRVDQRAGQADPAGAEHPFGRHHAAAGQQAERRQGPGRSRDRVHQLMMTERDKARGWSGSMPFRTASTAASRCAPISPASGSVSEAITVAPVRRASASRSAGTAPSAQTTVHSSLTLIGRAGTPSPGTTRPRYARPRAA